MKINKPSKTQTIINISTNIILLGLVIIISLFSFMPKTVTTAGGNKMAIYNGNKNSDKVSLMINVYWGTEYIEQILTILKEYNIKTTFFVGGIWVEENQATLKNIINNGHEIGNHGYLHKDHSKLDESSNKQEIQACQNIVKSTTGIEMTLFAPPSGAYSDLTINAAESLNMQTIMWTRDTIDWRDKNAELIYNRAVKNVAGGDLILMHPTQKTVEALPKIIETILTKNLKITTVSETIKP